MSGMKRGREKRENEPYKRDSSMSMVVEVATTSTTKTKATKSVCCVGRSKKHI